MNVKLIGIAVAVLLIAASAHATSPTSLNVPANVSIRKTTVSDIAYQLYNDSDNTQINQLNFGTIEPGSSEAVHLYLQSSNGSGYVYVAWQSSELLPYMNLTALYGPMGDAYTWGTERRQWLLGTNLAFILILTTDANAPAIDNVHFTISFTLYTTPA